MVPNSCMYKFILNDFKLKAIIIKLENILITSRNNFEFLHETLTPYFQLFASKYKGCYKCTIVSVFSTNEKNICDSYTMGCPSVRVDYPRALASRLSYVQADKHSLAILYHLHQCKP